MADTALVVGSTYHDLEDLGVVLSINEPVMQPHDGRISLVGDSPAITATLTLVTTATYLDVESPSVYVEPSLSPVSDSIAFVGTAPTIALEYDLVVATDIFALESDELSLVESKTLTVGDTYMSLVSDNIDVAENVIMAAADGSIAVENATPALTLETNEWIPVPEITGTLTRPTAQEVLPDV